MDTRILIGCNKTMNIICRSIILNNDLDLSAGILSDFIDTLPQSFPLIIYRYAKA